MGILIDSYRFGGNGGGGTPIPTGNLVFYLRFNNSVVDETGNHSPTQVGITYASGLYSGGANEAAVFDESSYTIVEIPDSPDLSFVSGGVDQPFSFTTPINIEQIGGNSWIMDKRGQQGSANSRREYQFLYSNSLNALRVFLFDQSTGGYIERRDLNSLTDNTTYWIGFTYDGSGTGDGLKIYVNGALRSSISVLSGSYTAMENLGSPVRFGVPGWVGASTANNLTGKMDGAALWNKELTPEEIAAIYNKQAAGDELL